MPGWLVDDPRKITVNYIYVSNVQVPHKVKQTLDTHIVKKQTS
jgi:hypothetical protein